MITYRTPTAADAVDLDDMARASWIETFAHGYAADDVAAYLGEAYGADGQLRRDLADPAIAFRIARDDEVIVGFAKLAERRLPAPDPRPGAMELRQLYVLGPWHGSGVAAALMTWTIDTARMQGAPELYLSVFEENHRAQRFYRRFGFKHVGDYAFPVGSTIDRDLVLRLTL